MKRTAATQLALYAGLTGTALTLIGLGWHQWWNAYPATGAPLHDSFAPETVRFELGMNQANKVSLPSGTVVSIPALAFVDEQGKTVTDAVLEVREYHSAADILKGGILMQMEAGSPAHLQSAGMLDLVANAGGQPLALRSGVSLDVTMPADSMLGEEYRLWNFQDGQWLDAGDVAVLPNADREAALSSLDSSLQALANPPDPNDIPLPQAFEFTVDGNLSEAPYLKPYRGTVWEWIPDEEGQSPPLSTLRSAWTSCDISKEKRGEYLLTFEYERTGTGGELIQQEVSIRARPQDSKRNLRLKEEAYAQAKADWEVQTAALREERLRMEAQGAFSLQFSVSDLGLTNVDKLVTTEEWMLASLDFDFAPSVAVLDKSSIFLVLEDDQSVLNFIRADWGEIPVPANGRCHIYAVLGPNELAYVSPNEFTAQIRDHLQPRPFLVKRTVRTEKLTFAEGLSMLGKDDDLAVFTP